MFLTKPYRGWFESFIGLLIFYLYRGIKFYMRHSQTRMTVPGFLKTWSGTYSWVYKPPRALYTKTKQSFIYYVDHVNIPKEWT